ncbi:hypothetical protein FPANT_907 [Fusarium pseudoanthophilum]|uniref:Uncharacterized protein n=1 Tax=Fusarium pseudoanthophilum TaxID=48495 RepID=A0A8H5Q4T6_9HYPO|nr:hypothetical protein FPANT_907 [Fusarium pseudoanthophilum]
MSAFRPARSLQNFFVYKRPQARISICSLQHRSLETSSPAPETSSPGARAERRVRLMDRHDNEKVSYASPSFIAGFPFRYSYAQIINHDSFRKDMSKIPFGYAFVPSHKAAIGHICRRMARKQRREIFACVNTQRQNPPTDSQPKVGPQTAFGLYVPSDIADAAAIQFEEQVRAVQEKQIFYIREFFPYMHSRHIRSMHAKEYRYQKRSDWDLKKLMREVKWTVPQKVEKYLRDYIRKEGGRLTDEEVASVMRSWKDGSEMPNVGII